MKKTIRKISLPLSLLIIIASAITFSSCDSSDGGGEATDQGAWVKKLEFDFPSTVRSGSVSFKIGDAVYVGLGVNTSGVNENFLKDFYKYEGGSWAPVATVAAFPGVARSSAVAFVVNGKGYVGLGYDGNEYLNDFYEYDPIANSWTAIAPFEGGARAGATAFAIDSKGYVGTGYNLNSLLDFWSYDPSNNDWEPIESIRKKRTNAFSFVIDGKGYVGGGKDNGNLEYTFFEYDPINDNWTEKNDLLDDKTDDDANDKGYTIAREAAATFVIEGKGYVVGGARSSIDAENWQYTPGTDTWKKMAPFKGTSRLGAVGFSIGNLGYVGLGRNGGVYLDDFHVFDPAAPTE